MMENELDKKAD